MATDSLKILITGSCKGKYSTLFKRVSDVNTKSGPFDLLLCVGDFFGQNLDAYDELINGSTELPNVPTYILGRFPQEFSKFHPDTESFEKGCELVDDITYLGKLGILTTSRGLRIAYLNGSYRETKNEDKNQDYFCDEDYDNLVLQCQSSSNLVDILLTTDWPKGIFNHVNMTDQIQSIQSKVEESSCSSIKISQLCNSIKPRYHIVCHNSLSLFFERQPYRNHRVLNEQSRNATRFISMADVGNKDKMKWIYAFNITPAKSLPMAQICQQPNGTTENPFQTLLQQKQEQDEIKQGYSNQFRYDLSKMGHQEEDKRRNNKRKYKNNDDDDDGSNNNRSRNRINVDNQNCWFCLANPNVDKSLIISIGDHAYLALAKGGLTDDHMLILPIDHIRSTVEIENNDLKEEIEKYKNALTGYYKQQEMVPVFFERNFQSPHLQIQVLGLPLSKVDSLRKAVEEVFNKFEYNEMGLNDELEDQLPPGVPYFYLECYQHYKFFARISPKKVFFPRQIGRELMAHKLLLNCPERINWKNCSNTETDSQQFTKQIREKFKPFDFTI